MSMDVGGSKGGVKSDINVTPLVDVMLVLLIIMMIVAPLLQQGVSLKLPQATNTTEKPETSDQTVLAITPDKRLWLNTLPVAPGDLRRRVQELQAAGVTGPELWAEGSRLGREIAPELDGDLMGWHRAVFGKDYQKELIRTHIEEEHQRRAAERGARLAEKRRAAEAALA